MGKANLELHSALTTHLLATLLERGATQLDPALLRMLVTRALASGAKA